MGKLEASHHPASLSFERTVSRKKGILAALFAAVIAVHLWSLMRFPLPFVDDAWFASRAWGFILTRRNFGPLDVGVFDRFEGYWTFFPWLPTWFQSLALRLAGVPSLFAVRMVSLFFGLVLLGAVCAIAYRLGGWQLSFWSMLIVSTSWAFSYSAHLARPDIIAAAFGFVALALYLYHHSRRWWMSLLSGLCVALAFEVHPHSAIYGLALVGLYFVRWRWSLFRQRAFWCFVAGVGVGLVFYAVLYIFPSPNTFFALNRLAFAPTHTPPLLTFDLSVLAQSVEDMGRLLLPMYHVLIPVVVGAVFILCRQRSESARTLVTLIGVLLAASILLIRNKGHYYAILFTPAIDLVVASLACEVGRHPWHGSPVDYISRIVVWGGCLAGVLLNLTLLRYNFVRIYQTVQSRINQVVRPGESIMAPQTYWFGLYDHTYYSWEELVYYRRYAPGSTVEDALREFRPDVMIIDESWDCFISDQPGDSPYLQHLRLSRTEMETFLERQADLVVEFDGAAYGQVRVYRIAWEGE